VCRAGPLEPNLINKIQTDSQSGSYYVGYLIGCRVSSAKQKGS